MVYRLLHRRVREKVSRESLSTFTELLRNCRLVEETFVTDTRVPVKHKEKQLRCQYCKYIGHSKDECKKLLAKTKGVKSDHKVAAQLVSQTQVSFASATTQSIVRSSTSQHTSETSKVAPSVQCYGCGKPGYIRSKCHKCNGTATASMKFLTFEPLIVPRS